ncbi:MAG TPA: protein kinase [Polyangiaceae bacterium]|jgi:serine/threonine-protein kinase|nr:protein kinase [Polyangiaceae bacterium]
MASIHSDGIGVEAGDVLAGKYRVDRVLGEGGMGVVVAAHHMQLDERVALKFLREDALDSPEAVDRFVREARAAVKIKSEHVARVIDVGKLENGAPYIVMEYLDGRDLDAWLEERGALPLDQAVEFVLQACEAIAEAHALGIVHRDLKPANLFCVRRADGLLSIKVLDFGISKMTPGVSSKSEHKMTRTNAVLGSPFYMSPEQMRSSRDADPRSDIWSLGVILYQLVTARMPFEAEAMPELVLKIADSSPPSMRTYRPELALAFEAIVMRCLEKERSRRFANVGELAQALYEYGPPRARGSVDRVMRTLETAGLIPGATPPPREALGSSPTLAQGLVGAVTPPPRALTMDSWGQTGSRPRASRRTAILAVVGIATVVLVAGGVTGGLLLRDRAKPASPLELAPSGSTAATVLPSSTTGPELVASAPASVAEPVAPSSSPPSLAVSTAPSATPAPPIAVRPSNAPPVQRLGTSPPTKTAVPTKSCNPPYFIDSLGRRQYKPECL